MREIHVSSRKIIFHEQSQPSSNTCVLGSRTSFFEPSTNTCEIKIFKKIYRISVVDLPQHSVSLCQAISTSRLSDAVLPHLVSCIIRMQAPSPLWLPLVFILSNLSGGCRLIQQIIKCSFQYNNFSSECRLVQQLVKGSIQHNYLVCGCILV